MGDFDPSKHLRKLRGRGGESDYLDVKWRIVWFRDRFPSGHIETQHIELSDVHAIFRASVTAIGDGGEVCGRATGYGSETQGDFQDFIEKAESRAVGRALAALGFGTQFAADEFGESVANATVDGTQDVKGLAREVLAQRSRPRNAPQTRPEPQGEPQPPVSNEQATMEIADETAARLFTNIEHAASVKELQSIAAEITRANLDEGTKQRLRAAYKRRQTAFDATT